MINVQDCGAYGDGIHDDTGAFLKAITALPANGGKIVVPATGSVYLVGTIPWTKPGIVIDGDSDGGTRIKLGDGVNDDMFRIGDGGTTDAYMLAPTFRNLHLEGNKGNQTAGHGIHSWVTRGMRVIDCTIRDFYGNGVRGEGGNPPPPAQGNDYYGLVRDCYIVGNGDSGIRLQGKCYTYGIFGNTIAGNGKGSGTGAGFHAVGNDTHKVMGNTFDENLIGARLYGCSDVTFEANVFENQDQYAALLDGGTHHCSITGGRILSGNLTQADTYSGIATDGHHNAFMGIPIGRTNDPRMKAGVEELSGADWNTIIGINVTNALYDVIKVGANTVTVGNSLS